MEKETLRVFFSLFFLFTLFLHNQQIMANELVIGNQLAKVASSTLHIHDEVKAHKLFHKVSDVRKRKGVLRWS